MKFVFGITTANGRRPGKVEKSSYEAHLVLYPLGFFGDHSPR